MSAAEVALDDALREMAEVAEFTPCRYDPEYWYADNPTDRANAAELCQRCPVIALCATVAAELPIGLRVGVWAGRDLTRTKTAEAAS